MFLRLSSQAPTCVQELLKAHLSQKHVNDVYNYLVHTVGMLCAASPDQNSHPSASASVDAPVARVSENHSLTDPGNGVPTDLGKGICADSANGSARVSDSEIKTPMVVS